MSELMTKLTAIFEEVQRDQEAYYAAHPNSGAAVFNRLETETTANDHAAMGHAHHRQIAVNGFIRQYDAVVRERDELHRVIAEALQMAEDGIGCNARSLSELKALAEHLRKHYDGPVKPSFEL